MASLNARILIEFLENKTQNLEEINENKKQSALYSSRVKRFCPQIVKMSASAACSRRPF